MVIHLIHAKAIQLVSTFMTYFSLISSLPPSFEIENLKLVNFFFLHILRSSIQVQSYHLANIIGRVVVHRFDVHCASIVIMVASKCPKV